MGVAPHVFSQATARWFADTFPEGPTPAQERAGPPSRAAQRPDPGPDRLRQDARGVPARHRPARHHARRRHRHPAALRLAAEGAQLRRRAQPARTAGRHPRDRRAPRPGAARDLASPCAPATRRPATAQPHAAPPAGRDDHHAREPLPAAHVAERARDAARGRDRDRRRGARGRRRPSAARTSRSAWSAWSTSWAGPCSASRSRPPSGRWRRSRGSSAATARSRSSTPAPPRSSTCRSSCRSRTWPRRPRSRSADQSRRPAGQPLDLAGDVPAAAGARAGAPHDARLRQLPAPRRAPGPAPQRAGRRGGRTRPPRLAGPRGARRDRGGS